jgi:chromosome segregation ATPase
LCQESPGIRIQEVGRKLDKLEGEMEELKNSIRAAIDAGNMQLALVREQRLAGLQQEKAGLQQEKAGLQQEKAGLQQEKAGLQQRENLLLERSLQAERGACRGVG